MPLQQSMLLIIITILTRMLVVVVHGQGYLCSPSSRQTFAAVQGVRSVEDAAAGLLPLQEQCVFCHVSTPLHQQNVCGGLAPRPDDGTETKRNYHDAYMVADGSSVVPFTSQGTYAEGGTLVIESILRTNRRGHIEVSVCNMDDNDDGTAPTQDCFNANPLLFDQDLLYGAPIHNEYPHRAYIPPSDLDNPSLQYSHCGSVGVRGLKLQHRFRLPPGVTGRVLLQWRWITNVGCRSPGYDTYPWPTGWELRGGDRNQVCSSSPSSYYTTGTIQSPQQYYQCSEITIERNDDTPSVSPVVSLPTPPTYYTRNEDGHLCRDCCALNGVCPEWNNDCFTADKCGVAPECRWDNQEWTTECLDQEGCCAYQGICPTTWTDPCFAYDKCGHDNHAADSWCHWEGKLSWIGPIPAV